MNPDLEKLQLYPFQRLAQLKAEVEAPKHLSHIALSIGEPKHAPPGFVIDKLRDSLNKISSYPVTAGMPALRETIADWASKRFNLAPNTLVGEEHVLPVNGTREALFAIAQCIVDRAKTKPKIVMPNPFYQIYEGAALLAGAEPVLLNCTEENSFLPDFSAVDEKTWQDCQLVFTCTPGNPTGAVMPIEQMQQLIMLADKYDFVIASDECYSELYFDENSPPPGLLEACKAMGRDDYKRCLVFHSLSKRSNLPGLRSGFVAGDKTLIKSFLSYRTYHGCAMPIPTQLASIAAWQDETHVKGNRDIYLEKFSSVLKILDGSLDVQAPQASFYLWPKTPICEKAFCQKLFAEKHITALPGSFLARNTQQGNPGEHRVRMALVATKNECVEAAERIKDFCQGL